ncbi:CheR family methyltransferase [Halovulum sp. GXIMD14794]
MTASAPILSPPPALSESDFGRIARRIEEMAGIVLEPHKAQMIRTRLERRLRDTGLRRMSDYLDLLDDRANRTELQAFVDALTTNQTAMFREPHHLAHLEGTVRAMRSGTSLRIWSAGCASGEEAYSIALTVMGARGFMPPGTRILASDIDSKMVETARTGTVDSTRCTGMEERHVALMRASPGGRKAPPHAALQAIAFRRLNLLEPWPMRGQFDAIFCRNVMIYFSAATTARLLERFTAQLVPGGYLYLGHAEALLDRTPGLRSCGGTIYRREETP